MAMNSIDRAIPVSPTYETQRIGGASNFGSMQAIEYGKAKLNKQEKINTIKKDETKDKKVLASEKMEGENTGGKKEESRKEKDSQLKKKVLDDFIKSTIDIRC